MRRFEKMVYALALLTPALLPLGCSPQGVETETSESLDTQREETAAEPTATPEPVYVDVGENIVANPSVESYELEWYGKAAEVARVMDPAYAHTGDYGVSIATTRNTWSGAVYGTDSSQGEFTSTVVVEPNTSYRVSVWAKGIENYEGVKVQLHVRGDQGNDYGAGGVQVPLSDSWQEISHVITTKENTGHLALMLVKVNTETEATFAADDLTVIQVERENPAM